METKSLQPGSTAASRRVLKDVTVALAPAPAATAEGFHFQGGDWMHVYIAYKTGATAATVVPWYFSEIAELWFQGDAIAFTATDKMAVVEVKGEHKLFFQVTSITGGGGTIDLWAGFSFEGRAE